MSLICIYLALSDVVTGEMHEKAVEKYLWKANLSVQFILDYFLVKLAT